VSPYYQDDAVTIYHGDCREITPRVTAEVLVTDPPYGVNLGGPDVGRNGRGGRHGLEKAAYCSYDDTYENYVEVIVPTVAAALNRVKRGAVFSGPHLQELPKAAAIGGVYCPAGSGRHAWGFKTFLPVLFYGTDPTLQHGAKPNVIQSTATADVNGHPCPKPLSWLRWLVGLTSVPGETIVDPFAGSGTTLRAAKDLGRRAIGIEIEERYCEIAAKRCAQEVLDFGSAA
jgi:site-specific DNA-methyltransferase (adenine-specific)